MLRLPSSQPPLPSLPLERVFPPIHLRDITSAANPRSTLGSPPSKTYLAQKGPRHYLRCSNHFRRLLCGEAAVLPRAPSRPQLSHHSEDAYFQSVDSRSHSFHCYPQIMTIGGGRDVALTVKQYRCFHIWLSLHLNRPAMCSVLFFQATPFQLSYYITH